MRAGASIECATISPAIKRRCVMFTTSSGYFDLGSTHS
jgi:hypothetical protein